MGGSCIGTPQYVAIHTLIDNDGTGEPAPTIRADAMHMCKGEQDNKNVHEICTQLSL